MGSSSQENIAFMIVAFAVLSVFLAAYRKYVARPLAIWLLKQGKVRLAMRVRSQAKSQSGCDGCSCGPTQGKGSPLSS